MLTVDHFISSGRKNLILILLPNKAAESEIGTTIPNLIVTDLASKVRYKPIEIVKVVPNSPSRGWLVSYPT